MQGQGYYYCSLRHLVRFGESVKKWLEIKAFQAWRGSPEWLVGSSFFALFDTAINVAIGK